MNQNLNNRHHIPVMLDDVLKNWVNVKNGLYVDCTFGCGGHTKQLLKQLSPQAKVIGVDADEDCFKFGEELEKQDKRFTFIKINFADFFEYWKQNNLPPVNGVLFDLGISTFQLKEKNIGLSYNDKEDFLDMRIDSESSKNASYILNTYSKQELLNIFKEYGEIKNPKKLVDLICEYRQKNNIETVGDLEEIIKRSFPVNKFKFNKNPTKLIMQALKIETNNEVQNLEKALNFLDSILAAKAYALFITFHSIEEKILKKWIDKNCKKIIIPDYACNVENKFELIDNTFILPDKAEVLTNWSSRSSKLWVFQKKFL